MDALIGLLADFAIDSGTVRDRAAGRKGAREFVYVRKIGGEKSRVGNFVCRRISAIESAREQNHLVAASYEGLGQMPPNKTRPTGDCDPHCHTLRNFGVVLAARIQP